MTIELRAFDETMLSLTSRWLSDPELRLLTQSPSIDREQQMAWFKGLEARKDYAIWTVVEAGTAIGVMGFKHIDQDSAEYFGYIGEQLWGGRGLGKQLMDSAFAIAAARGWRTISLHVLADNFIAVNLYFDKGFRIVSASDGIFYMTKQIAG